MKMNNNKYKPENIEIAIVKIGERSTFAKLSNSKISIRTTADDLARNSKMATKLEREEIEKGHKALKERAMGLYAYKQHPEKLIEELEKEELENKRLLRS